MRLSVIGICFGLALATSAAAQEQSAKLGQLHDALRLTAEQEGPWRDYVSAISPNPQAKARRRATAQLLPQLPTPRRIALIEAAMAQDSADFHRQGEAVKTLYDHLSPDQQRTFDRQTAASGEASGGGDDGGQRPLRTPPPGDAR